MKIIIIKTQKELDILPSNFDEYTHIEIRSTERISITKARENSSVLARENSSVVARGNSSVVAWEKSSVVAWEKSSVVARGNSSVEAWEKSSVVARGNSSVEAWGNSSVELFLFACVIVLSPQVVIKKLLDHCTAVFKGCPINIKEKSNTSHTREVPGHITVSFEEWLNRGWVYADGIYKKLKSQKKINDIEVFECEDFPKKTTSYVVKRDNIFSHGETIEKAIEDLRYKIGNRDASEFEFWKKDLNMEVSLGDAIAAYRIITGACVMGTKEFIESIKVPDKLTPNVIMELTKGKYGQESFRQFLGLPAQ